MVCLCVFLYIQRCVYVCVCVDLCVCVCFVYTHTHTHTQTHTHIYIYIYIYICIIYRQWCVCVWFYYTAHLPDTHTHTHSGVSMSGSIIHLRGNRDVQHEGCGVDQRNSQSSCWVKCQTAVIIQTLRTGLDSLVMTDKCKNISSLI